MATARKTSQTETAVNSFAATTAKAYEHIPCFLSKSEADDLHDLVLQQPWTEKPDGSGSLHYGVSYFRGGPTPEEIPAIPDFLRRLADRVSGLTHHPCNYVQVFKCPPGSREECVG